MLTTKRLAFERLMWRDRVQVPASPSLLNTVDDESIAALMALGGFHCHTCGKTLSDADGYVCCSTPHCPLCGDVLFGLTSCTHYVLLYATQTWRVPFNRLYAQEYPFLHSTQKWHDFWKVFPPAFRLPEQTQTGSPVWSEEQLNAAYSPDVRPHLQAVFGPTLTRFKGWKRLGPVLLLLLQPDFRTSSWYTGRQPTNFYFVTAPRPAVHRLVTFLTHLHEGTARLRAMPPEAFVRASQSSQNNL